MPKKIPKKFRKSPRPNHRCTSTWAGPYPELPNEPGQHQARRQQEPRSPTETWRQKNPWDIAKKRRPASRPLKREAEQPELYAKANLGLEELASNMNTHLIQCWSQTPISSAFLN